MWLTFATFVGYAIVYTVVLKPATPQNIVIGGASGAMPPLLGWAAITGEVTFQPLLLFLIVFAWTPPHFWALALYRRKEYALAGVPMLPVTHGEGVHAAALAALYAAARGGDTACHSRAGWRDSSIWAARWSSTPCSSPTPS
jgi:protoheme IX farnesyltransferase